MNDDHDDIVKALLELEDDRLSEWEINFIESIGERMEIEDSLTDNQFYKAVEIAERYNVTW